ncbi:hypothetical protein FRC05_009057 [Tulasnella sp. 425]|nr:hypothetical protein FRC05_009057 [Tulasnella sp. 425]
MKYLPTFTTNLDQANWLRFHAYSRRVRTVKISPPMERWSRPVSEDSLEIVQASMPPWCHFPRPTRVSYEAVCVTPTLVVPSLHNLLCSVSASTKELDVFVTDFIAEDRDDSPVQDFFRRIGELDASSLESITVNLFLYFSQSSSLPNLIRRHASTVSALCLRIPFSEPLWTAVQDLRNLKRFSLDLKAACDPLISPHDSLTVLGDLISGPLLRLEEFTLSLSQLDICAEQRLLGIFRCISRMTELRTLTLTSNTQIMPHASKMLDMGRNLCQLQTLRVDITHIRVRMDGKIETLSYLIPILQTFPRLRRLGIRIVCCFVPDVVRTEVHSLLEILDVSWSPAPKAKPEAVAVFLRSVLPRRARVVYTDADASPRVDSGKAAWAKIARLVSEA